MLFKNYAIPSSVISFGDKKIRTGSNKKNLKAEKTMHIEIRMTLISDVKMQVKNKAYVL